MFANSDQWINELLQYKYQYLRRKKLQLPKLTYMPETYVIWRDKLFTFNSYLKYAIRLPSIGKCSMAEEKYHKRQRQRRRKDNISQAITKITLQEILNNNHIEYEFYLKILQRHIAQFRLLNEHVIFLIVLTCTITFFFLYQSLIREFTSTNNAYLR